MLIILLCISLYMAYPCKAATVWSDDFDDGDYDGWTVTVGSFSAEENTLEAGSGDANLVYHPSSVATGTWSFDILIGAIDHADVFFMCSDAAIDQAYDFTQIDRSCYLALSDEGVVLLRQRDGPFEALTGYDFKIEISGWQHIDVTRNSDGRICVYQDGNLVIDTVETSVTTSQFFAFWNTGEEATIDNIVVSNTVDIEPPRSIPFYMQTWFLATVGVVAVAIVVIVAFLKLRK